MTLPPHLLAAVDQHRALLAELAHHARVHAAADQCPCPQICPGQKVLDRLNALPPRYQSLLVCQMVAELGALGYGLPARRAEAAPAVMDEPSSRPWWRRLMPRRGGDVEE
ncbi:hypothetical protein AB0C02_27945 [Micromonospora sp. NPDC048999]|uniref:hypothetical protein n=1 Tax=Micromonospora sp. NPDC048999 TaxID=3155391 RepID=UPI0033DF4668